MRVKGGTVATAGVAVALFSVIIFFLQGWGSSLSLPATLGESLLAVLPGIFFTSIGVIGVAVSPRGSPMVVGGVACVGVGAAVLVGLMFNASLLTDAMVGGWTKENIQVVVVIASMVLGSVIYALKH